MELPSKNLVLKRAYLPENFEVVDWDSIEPYYKELTVRKLKDLDSLEAWIKDRNELEAAVDENSRWRYIRVSCDTADEKAAADFRDFVENITPKISPYTQKLNKKLVDCPYVHHLNEEKYGIYLRKIRNSIRLYKKKNIPIHTQIQVLTKQYGEIASKMTVELDDKEMTLQQAETNLTSTDREYRESIYRVTSGRRLEDSEKLDELFDQLLAKRHELAINAGFENYRDFKFAALERFDYSPEDCAEFHRSISELVVPLVERIHKKRKKKLNLKKLKPWDLSVDPFHKDVLIPFKGEAEMMDKTNECLTKTHPYFGECFNILREMDHLDLESRKGKRPGGYNMPLPETGVPFIFMNSANGMRDMRTILHESGHAVHSFLMKDMDLNIDRSPPSEVAELAAMAMELLTFENWNEFFDSEKELKRAKLWQLKNSIQLIPWVATIDKFQHWLYTNIGHSWKERDEAWTEIFMEFESLEVDWNGLEEVRGKLWQRQLHLFEVPFYYIEYGIAQLGAIAIWRTFKEEGYLAIDRYIDALGLGYTASIGEIYEAAGIKFEFSSSYIDDLVDFMTNEIAVLS